MIPLAEPYLNGNEWSYVKECLDTNWVSSAGRFVGRFEELIAEATAIPHAVAVVNGTAALHLALRVAGVEPGDEVLVSTLTFVASANAIHAAGAQPLFVDAEPSYWQIDAQLVEAFLAEQCEHRDGHLVNRASGRRVAAILPAHILGHPVDIDALVALGERYGVPVVEDAAEALGSRCRDRQVGAHGRVGAFSFNGNKLITTGGGGMLVTHDARLAERARHLATQAKADPLEYTHDERGCNYRLTNLLAAIGCAQVEQLPHCLAAKARIAARYRQAFANTEGLASMPEAPWARSTWWMFTLRVDAQRFGIDARALHQLLAETNIQTRPIWQPLHATPAYRGCRHLGGEVAVKLWHQCLSLPCSVGLSEAQQEEVIAAILKAVPHR